MEYKHDLYCSDVGHLFNKDGNIYACVTSIRAINLKMTAFVNAGGLKALKK